MEEKYLIHVDTVCKYCGYRNQIQAELDYKVDVICCGECSNFILAPKELSIEEQKEIVDLMNKERKEC